MCLFTLFFFTADTNISTMSDYIRLLQNTLLNGVFYFSQS